MLEVCLMDGLLDDDITEQLLIDCRVLHSINP